MILLCGVREFPSGIRTQELASHVAERLGADLAFADGEPAAQAVAAVGGGDVLLVGHAPPRGIASAHREAPCPVVVAPAGVCASDWGEVVLGSRADADDDGAAATAGVLAASLGAVLRIVVVRPDERSQGDHISKRVRRLGRAALASAGSPLAVEAELRIGPPAAELLRAADERDTALVVVAADARARRLDRFRPSTTEVLVHNSREPVVIVPPGTGLGPALVAQRALEPTRA